MNYTGHMAKLNFTKRALEAILPATTRTYYLDTKVDGLVLVVQPSGTKSFQVYKRPRHGRPVRHTLGRFPDMSVKRARQLAYDRLAEMVEGVDPNAARRTAARHEITLDKAFNEYVKTRKSLKLGTIKDYERHLKEHFSDWRTRPLREIDKNDIEQRYQRIGLKSKARANGAMRLLRAVFNFAMVAYEADGKGTPLFPLNPVLVLSKKRAWYHVPRRRTVLKPDQVRPWHEAVMALESRRESSQAEAVRDWLRLLLFTGMRPGEALALRWLDIDLKHRSFTLHDPKNRQSITLPLTHVTHEILTARRQNLAPDTEWVFPAIRHGGHMTEPKEHYRKVREKSGIYFTPHDLRRTFLTIAESLDITGYTLKRLVNHKLNQDVTAGYIISDVDRLRAPCQRITTELLRLIAPSPGSEDQFSR